MDPRDVELLTNNVADKALEKITKRLRWPLILAAVLATYTGYNLWSDVRNRIDTFQKSADEKLAQIEKNANERLGKGLQKAIEARSTDLTELTTQLRKETAAAFVEAERAHVQASESSKKIEKESKDTIARLKQQSDATIAELENQLREVSSRSQSVLVAVGVIEMNISKRNRQIIDNDPQVPRRRLLDQDALTLIGVKAAIEDISEAKPVKVAVLSTGVTKFKTTPTGETLEGRLVEGRSFIPGENLEDKQGNGTQVASLVAVIAPKAQILPVKVLPNKGVGSPEGIVLQGLAYAMSADARIVVLPLSRPTIPGETSIYSPMFRSLRDKGVLIFATVGNDSHREKGYIRPVGSPGNCPPAIAVTSTSLKDRLMDFTNRGREVALAAPGEDIVTIGPDGMYKSYRGGSYSTAIAASIAALVLSARPDLSAEDVESILRQSAKHLVDLGADDVGAGRVDALAAVRLAKTYKSSKK
jgi:subtilisin family serine protease